MSSTYFLRQNNSSLTIDFTGGRIAHLVLAGIPLLGTFDRIDGKKGNTHLCVPNFGNEGVERYRLPHHGPAREAVWKLISQTTTSLTLGYDMPKTGIYPATLSVIQTFSLADRSYTQEITVINTGRTKAPVNCAIHYYWYTPHGWEDILVNDQPVSELIKKDTFLRVQPKNRIHIPSYPTIRLELSSNFEKMQFWTARKETSGTIVYDRAYACVEPVLGTGDFFTSEPSMLFPRESLSIWVRLVV